MLNLNFAAGDGIKMFKLEYTVLNQSGLTVEASKQVVAFNFIVVDDFCQTYAIDSSWPGFTTDTSVTRMDLYFGISYTLSVEEATFQKHPLDSTSNCQKTLRWVDSNGVPLASSGFSTTPQQAGQSSVSIHLADDQTSYPVPADYFLEACILDQAGLVVESSCITTTLKATLLGDICDSYTISSSWTGLSPSTSASSRKKLFYDVDYTFTAADFTFTPNPIDSPS